jgi:hypothetical protein
MVRRGAALLIVLGVVMVVTIVAFAYLSRSDGELQYGQNMLLRMQADYLAESALEHARGLVLNPQEVSGEYWTGASAQQIETGDFYYDVSVEPNVAYSGSTRWCDYDISCRAYKLNGGERTAQSNLNALLRLNPCIAYYCRPGSAQQLSSVMKINGDLYCGNDLVILGTDTVDGDVFCDNLNGTITGQDYPSSELLLDWPRVDANDFTSNYPVDTVGSSVISAQELGPYSPSRIFRRAGDLEIAGDVSITGMLLVEGNLLITSTGNEIKAGKALPAMLVTGNLTIDEGAGVDIEGLGVIEGQVLVSTGCEDVNVLGGLFAGDGIAEFAADDAGNRHDAIIVGEPVWLPTGGRVGGAAELNGSSEKIEEYDAEDYLNGLSAITVACWVKSDVVNVDRDIFFTKNPTDIDDELSLRYDKAGFLGGGVKGIKASIRTSAGYKQIESSSDVQTTDWQHLALVWQSGQSLRLYINGIEDSLRHDDGNIAGTINGVEKFMLGCGTKRQYWDGKIDDLQIYNRALDVNDIQTVKEGFTMSGLIAHWKLDEDGQRRVAVTAAPAKTAIWCWSQSGQRQKWAQAAGAFYKVIRRN